MKRYYASQERFSRIDGDNFGMCMTQILSTKQEMSLEWRIRKVDNKMCIIQYYKDGRGYQIYEPEIIPVILEALKTTRTLNLHLYEEGTVGNHAYKTIEQAIKLISNENK